MRIVFLCSIALMFVGGCSNRTAKNMQTAIANTVKSDKYVSDFDRLFPGTKHFITYYTEYYGDPIWNSKIFINGDYELTMQFAISIDSTGTQVTRESEPRFYLWKIDRTETLPDGRTATHYGGGLDFGPEEWEELLEAGGDLSVLPMDREPQPGFTRPLPQNESR